MPFRYSIIEWNGMYFVWRVDRYILSLSEVHCIVYLQDRYAKNIWTKTGSYLQMTIYHIYLLSYYARFSLGYSLFAAPNFTELLRKNLWCIIRHLKWIVNIYVFFLRRKNHFVICSNSGNMNCILYIIILLFLLFCTYNFIL